MDLRTTITKTLIGEEVEQLDEASRYSPDLTDMGRSELWHNHSQAYDQHMNNDGGKKYEKLHQKIHAHVAKVHGKEMADDMLKHSFIHTRDSYGTVGEQMPGAKEALKLRKKHNINKKKGVGYNWHYTGEKGDEDKE
jgi:hypothetical protein